MNIAKLLAAAALAAPFSSALAQTAAPADSGQKSDRAAWLAGTATGGALFVLFTRSGHTAASSTTSGGFAGFASAPTSPGSPTAPAGGAGTSPVPSPAGGSTTGSNSPGGSGDGSAPSSTAPVYTPPTDNGSSGLTFFNVPHDTASMDQTGTDDHTKGGQNSPPGSGPPAANDPPPSGGPGPKFNSPDQTPGQSPDDAGEPQDTPPGHFDSLFAPTQSSQESFIQSVDQTSTVPEPASLALTATGIVGLLPLIRRRK